MARILIVDDEENICQVLSTLLKSQGHETVPLQNGQEAIDKISAEDFDLLLSDIRMHPVNGMQILEHAGKVKPAMPVVMLTAYSSLETAATSLKLGAFDYLPKPFKVNELMDTINRAIDYGSALKQKKKVADDQPPRYHIDNVIAESPAMQAVCELVKRIGPTNSPVFIYGEKGVGKALIARAIHDHSRRNENKFVTINCEETPGAQLKDKLFGHEKGATEDSSEAFPGALEEAKDGSIFIEGINLLPLDVQRDICDMISTRKKTRLGGKQQTAPDVRFLASADTDPNELLSKGELDQDLHSRLAVMPVEIKPLRERREDIIPIVKHLMQSLSGNESTRLSLDPQVAAVLQSYPWPGNVKELENTITEAVRKSENGVIKKKDLPGKIADTPILKEVVSDLRELESTRGKALKRFLKTKESHYLKNIRPRRSQDK